jgi:hypothetical protein
MYGNVSQYLAYKAIYEFDIFADAKRKDAVRNNLR